VLNALEEKGHISQTRRAKSLTLTEVGVERAEEIIYLLLASGLSRKGSAHQVGNLFHLGDVQKAVIETHMTVTTFTSEDGKVDIASSPLLGGRSNEFQFFGRVRLGSAGFAYAHNQNPPIGDGIERAAQMVGLSPGHNGRYSSPGKQRQ
jgi:hypothetical protein